MTKLKLLRGLLIATSLGITLYWIAVFADLFPQKELVPGYVNWFMAFPLADFYIAACALLGMYFFRKNSKLSALFIICAGSGLIFLGLNALLYGHVTGLLYSGTVDEMIEICVKVYCLTVGPYFIYKSWKIITCD